MFFKKIKHGKNLKILSPCTTFIGEKVILGNNVTIYPNNHVDGNTVIGDNCVLLGGNHIVGCIIDQNVTLESTHAENCTIEKDCKIGPFARLRPNTCLGKRCKIGNFVEIKNSTLQEGCKVGHLAYVGDADLGKNCNIGCGVIFVNFNGKTKSRSTVGNDCFLGSNCNIIAPVHIDDDVYISAGTTVTNDLIKGDFVIGRCRQEVKPNRAYNYLKEKE